MENTKPKTGLYIAIVVIVAIALIVGAWFLLGDKGSVDIFSKSIKNEVITAENYEEVTKKFQEEVGESDELYYAGYAMFYYIMKDGMASAFEPNPDESAVYANIYGKTMKQLVEEGKQLMKDNNVTIEQFKQGMQEFGNTTIE